MKVVESFRIDNELWEIYRKKCREVGVKPTSFITTLIERFVKKDWENISDEEKLELLHQEAEKWRRLEESIYKQWKSLLRSSRYAYLLRDVEKQDLNDPERRKKLIQRIIHQDDIPQDFKNAIIGLLEMRDYCSERLAKVYSQIKEILERLAPTAKKDIEEALEVKKEA